VDVVNAIDRRALANGLLRGRSAVIRQAVSHWLREQLATDPTLPMKSEAL
jgi:hypothetical protein